jgi:hypothetical protein
MELVAPSQRPSLYELLQICPGLINPNEKVISIARSLPPEKIGLLPYEHKKVINALCKQYNITVTRSCK